ncbi:MAG: protein kinase [Gemmatimonadota bacterium]
MTEARVTLIAALADRYTIERELGQGGMATVYLAEDLKHHRKVAVKVLRPDLAATMGAERFEREIQVAARLTHPHILGVLDSGEADGFFYYVMPYVEGETLRDRLTRSGELPVADALRLLSEVTEALAVAHKGGVVHRDIKPENILLSGRHALVMDFGVAKAVTESSGRQQITTAGIALGTPAYMAPEQATADPQLDHRVDIYALGVLAYEMLTGYPPFHGLTPQATLAAHVTQQPMPVAARRPGISPALDAIIMRCLAKRPADRFQTADELVAALEPLATPSGGMTPTHTAPVRAVAAPRTKSWTRMALGAVVLVAACVAAFIYWNRVPATASLLDPSQLTRSAGVQEAPVITRDGKGVAYRTLIPGDTAPRVELRRGSDGSAVPLALIGSPRSWSPDDRLLIATPRGLESVPALGGVGTMVVAGARHGTWSPDGQRVAYVHDDSILVRTADGRQASLAVTREPHSLAWSPDGRWIVYVSGNSRTLDDWNIAPSSLWLVPAAGGTATQLTPGDAPDLSPAWAPDSRRLLFASNRSGTRDIYQLNLDSRGQPRGEPIRVTTGLNVSRFTLSADGTQVAYSVATNLSNVWRVAIPATGALSTRAAEIVTTDRESLESIWISPDGQWLYFDSDRAGVQQIFRRPLAGGDVQQITHGSAPAFSVAVSPDGTQIAFHTISNGERRSFVASSQGGDQPVQLSDGTDPDERNPTWSRDASRMIWQSYKGGTIAGAVPTAHVVKRESRGWGAARLINPPGVFAGSAWIDSISVVGLDSASHRVVVLNVENPSGPLRYLTGSLPVNETPLSNAVISMDGRTVFWQNRSGIRMLPVTGGTPRQVVRFDDPLHPHSFVARSVAESAGRLYFTLQEPESTIWVARVKGLER